MAFISNEFFINHLNIVFQQWLHIIIIQYVRQYKDYTRCILNYKYYRVDNNNLYLCLHYEFEYAEHLIHGIRKQNYVNRYGTWIGRASKVNNFLYLYCQITFGNPLNKNKI